MCAAPPVLVRLVDVSYHLLERDLGDVSDPVDLGAEVLQLAVLVEPTHGLPEHPIRGLSLLDSQVPHDTLRAQSSGRTFGLFGCEVRPIPATFYHRVHRLGVAHINNRSLGIRESQCGACV